MAAARKVVITGGGGFIGSHTAIELHAAGYQPVVVDNFGASDRRIIGRAQELAGAEFAVHEVDCRDHRALSRVFQSEGECFGVIHFAAHKAVGASGPEALSYYDNNLGSLLTLLGVMHEAKQRRLVFSSSATVYGEADDLPVTERSPTKPAESVYGRTKQIGEQIIADTAVSKTPLQSVVLRYFNPVGAHPSSRIGELPIGTPANLVPYITQTAIGLRPELTVFGDDYDTVDGTCMRDYLHVVDLAKAHVASLDYIGRQSRDHFNEIFNVGTGQATSVLQAIGAFEQASGTKLRYRVGPRRSGDVVSSYANVDKARAELGWRAELTILDAMRDAWNWQVALKNDPL
ncbi:MAG TPA: UDP-glucose 4-epimerase GalE [Polyangiaceae bacterium]|nr:UDP-glucose 4-epimerase GalE [Polyangiaceae bacterium]